MTNELSYFAKVSDSGELQGLPRTKLRKELKGLFAGKQIEILIHRKKKHRSVQQNRYYWLIVSMLSEHTGFTKSETHEILKQRFLKTEKVHEDTGAIYEYTKSTTELTTTEHMDYSEQIKQWAAQEFDIVLPDPGEQMDLITHQLNETV